VGLHRSVISQIPGLFARFKHTPFTHFNHKPFTYFKHTVLAYFMHTICFGRTALMREAFLYPDSPTIAMLNLPMQYPYFWRNSSTFSGAGRTSGGIPCNKRSFSPSPYAPSSSSPPPAPFLFLPFLLCTQYDCYPAPNIVQHSQTDTGTGAYRACEESRVFSGFLRARRTFLRCMPCATPSPLSRHTNDDSLAPATTSSPAP